MFKIAKPRPKAVGEKGRELILEKALKLFREKGFEATTMRDIAKAADIATGAAYYYFPCKEAIVAAYYDQVQRRHATRVFEELAKKEGLQERLAVVLHSKLEILREDRKFLGALFRYTGEPGHPLSVFGKGTAEQRVQSMEMFRGALAGADLTEELLQILPWGLWLAHLGMILFFLYDESAGQAKTHRLVDGGVGLLVSLVGLTNSTLARPFVKPFLVQGLEMLRGAGLVLGN